MKNKFFLQLNITRKCNQSCYYCNVFSSTKLNSGEVDEDFLRFVLLKYPKDIMIQICGGEPGIIKNVDNVFKIVYNNTSMIEVLSNGLVRKREFDWLNKIKYFEHLIFDIEEDYINKFYDMNFIKEDYIKYVVVMTEKTTKSLLKNFDLFKSKDMFNGNFFYKIMNEKTHRIKGYEYDLLDFFRKIKDNESFEMVRRFLFPQKTHINLKTLCAKNAPYSTIDFETRRIHHCSNYLIDSKTYELTDENITKHLESRLFDIEDYCKKCYVFDTKEKVNCIIKSMKGQYCNR